jgi:hypothetical protein
LLINAKYHISIDEPSQTCSNSRLSFELISGISSHSAVFFSHNKPANSIFSHNKPAKRTGCGKQEHNHHSEKKYFLVDDVIKNVRLQT